MKLLALTVLLAIMQAGPPIGRKASNSPAQTTADIGSKGASDKTKSPPTPSPAKADSNGPVKNNSGEQHSEDTQHTIGISKLPAVTLNPSKRDAADWGYWAFSGFLVVVGFLQVWLLWWTLGEMRRQREVMSNQWKTMTNQLTEMAAQTAFLEKYVGHTETTAIAAKDSAEAAKKSADALMGIERAWIMVTLEARVRTPDGGFTALQIEGAGQSMTEAR